MRISQYPDAGPLSGLERVLIVSADSPQETLTTSAQAIADLVVNTSPSIGGGGGGGGSTAGKHAVPIMAGAMRPSIVSGCAPLAAIASASDKPDIVTLDFDPSSEQYAQFAVPMPKSWNEGTLTAKFIWSHASTTTNFGVAWTIQAVATSDDDTIAAAYGTAQTIADTGGTTNDLYISGETAAMTVGGSPAAEDFVHFRVYRQVAHGSDTMAVDARLHAVVLYMTTDADTDA